MAVILDIEMPTQCFDCPCCDKESGWCQVTGKTIFIERPYDCPLVEVKHGHWIASKKHSGDFYCSVCGQNASYGYYGIEADDLTDFCPNCAAIMDEET